MKYKHLTVDLETMSNKLKEEIEKIQKSAANEIVLS